MLNTNIVFINVEESGKTSDYKQNNKYAHEQHKTLTHFL